jgi:hypothetical protein
LTVARSESLAEPRPRFAVLRRTWPLVLGLAFVAVLVRGWLAARIPVPWIMTDELIYRELATSFAHSGHFLVRGEHIGLVSLYPVVLAPLWRAGSTALSFDLSKALNIVAMTATSVLVFVWARRLVRTRYAFAAFVLSLLMPAFLYTTELMSENVAMPAFVLAAFAIWRALQRPTLAAQAWVVGTIALSCAIRFQGAVLVPIWATAIALSALLSAERPGRGRATLRAFRPYWPSAVAIAVLAGGYLLVTVARGKSVLGYYEGVTRSTYAIGPLARWFVYHLAEFSIAVGLIPAAALLLLLGGALRRRVTPAVAAILALAVSSVVWLSALAGTWASWNADGIRERYDMYAVPLVLIAFAVFLERAAPRRRFVLAAGALACLAPLALPIHHLLTFGVESKAPSLDVFDWLNRHSGDLVRPVFAAFAVAAVALLLLGRRLGTGACLGFVGVVFLLITLSGSALAKDLADRIKASSLASSWVDNTIGSGADVAYVWTDAVDPNWLWQVEFWNRSVQKVYHLHNRDPGTLPTERLVIDPHSGELLVAGRPLPVGALASDRSFYAQGPIVDALTNGLHLTRTPPPAKVQALLTGVYIDAWTGPVLGYTIPACRGSTTVALAFHTSPFASPQTLTARQAGVVVARKRVEPGSRSILRAPLDAAKGTCTLSVEISPTWNPSRRLGSPDTRDLGVVLDSAIPIRS